MRDRVPWGRGKFKSIEIPPATFEVGSSLQKLGEEVTNMYETKYTVDISLNKLQQ
jgi:hypothetical protein